MSSILPLLQFRKFIRHVSSSYPAENLILFLVLSIFLVSIPIVAYNLVRGDAIVGAEVSCTKADLPVFGVVPDDERAKKVVGDLKAETEEIRNNKEKFAKDKGKFSEKLNSRKQKLAESMVRDANGTLTSVLSDDESKEFNLQADNCVETEYEATGILEVNHADFFKQKKSENLTILKTDKNEKIRLNFARGSHIPIESGAKVKVKGVKIDDTMLFDGGSSVSGSGRAGGIDLLESPGNPPVADVQGTVGIIVRFKDTPTPLVGPTNEQITRQLSDLENYYNKNSYGRVTVNKQVVGPLLINIPATCDFATIVDNTIPAVQSQVDFNIRQRVIIYAPLPDFIYCGWMGRGTVGKQIYAGKNVSVAIIAWPYATDQMVNFHEYGHNLGLLHAGGLICQDKPLGQTCVADGYGDYLDTMGSSVPPFELNLRHRQILGFLNSSQTLTVTTPGTFTISAIEIAEGIKGLIIPRNELENIYLELRTPYGYDYSISPNEYYYGAVVHVFGDGYSTDTTLVQKANTSGVFHPGDYFIDPQSGVKITIVSLDGELQNAKLTVKVEFTGGTQPCANCPVPQSNASNLQVSWNPSSSNLGYLSAVSRIKKVDWSNQTYVVSLKCTSDFLGCPKDLGDKLTTTSTNGDLQLANGFNYEYSVDIYTKKDGDPNSAARYFWYRKSTGVVNCPSGQSTCSVNVFWPEVTYKTTLFNEASGVNVCGGARGCQDYIALKSNSATFRGLMAVNGDINLGARVQVTDFNNNTHLLQNIGNLGKPDDFIKNCSGVGGCSIKNSSGIGPFIGDELVLYSVKVNDQNGTIIEGPKTAYTNTDGSFSRTWSLPGVKYSAVIYRQDAGGCLNTNSQCQTVSDLTGYSYIFGNLIAGANYKAVVCTPDCSTGKTIYEVTKTAPTPIPANLGDPILNCKSDGRVNAYFSWLPAGGVVVDEQYFDIGTDYAFFPGKYLPVKRLENNYTALDLPAGTTYYFRVNSKLMGGGWVSSRIRKMTTLCGSANMPLITCKDADVNKDKVVNVLDLYSVSKHTGYYPAYDVNGDGAVNSIDLSIVSKFYGPCP